MLRFFTNSAKSPFLFTPFIKRITSHRGTIGSASACQAGGHGFEPGLERNFFIAENIPVLSGRLVRYTLCRNPKDAMGPECISKR